MEIMPASDLTFLNILSSLANVNPIYLSSGIGIALLAVLLLLLVG